MTKYDRRYYDARRHEEALAQHERRWLEMRATRLKHGTRSVEYVLAHRAMVEAKRQVEAASRRPRSRS